MPVSVSYPGVYVQEIPSGQQTIGGVATSITAFVGRTYRGPVNQATRIFSFGDFQRQFGGLVNNFPLSFAVRDFFQNGGTQAVIVRIYGPSWLDFPVSPEQQSNASTAAAAMNTAVGENTTAADVASAVSAAAGQYLNGTYPEQWAAANWLVNLTAAWNTALGNAQLNALNSALGGIASQLEGGAGAVYSAMVQAYAQDVITGNAVPAADAAAPGYLQNIESMVKATAKDPSGSSTAPTTGPTVTVANATIDPTALLDAAQAAVAQQIPGATQLGAQQVVDIILSTYDATDATPETVIQAAYTATTEVSTAANALLAVATPSGDGTPPATAEALLNGLAQATTVNNPAIQFSVVNELIAQVMPTPSFAFPLTQAPLKSPVTIAQEMVTVSAKGGTAVQAAVPSTTASVVVQAPPGFVTVASAANGIAQAAWLAVTEKTAAGSAATSTLVAQAAQEAAAAYKQANPGFANTAAVSAAQAVANAAQAQVTQSPSTVAAAAGSAVAGAVQQALSLAATNSAITSLVAAEAVANATWLIGTGGTAPAASLGAIGSSAATDAVSAQVAQAVASAAGGAKPNLGQALGLSQQLVPIVASMLPALTLYAANAGDWANGDLAVTLNTNNITANSVAAMDLTPAPGNPPFGPGDLFNLAVSYTAPDGTAYSENWNAVSLRPDAGVQRIDNVLVNSNFIQYLWPGWTPGALYPATPPPLVPVSGAGGVAGVNTVPASLPPTGWTAPSGAPAVVQVTGTPSQLLQEDDYLQDQATHTGIYALEQVDQFDLLCIPPDIQITTLPPTQPPADPTDQMRLEVYQTAAVYCEKKLAMLILDPPSFWAGEVQAGNTTNISIDDLGTYGPEGEYAAVYFPYLIEGNPLLNGQLGYFAPSGAMAGIMARTDAARGVWKAPAGVNDGAISGTFGLQLKLSNNDSGLLNPQGINCLRTFPIYGSVVWGARTLKGADVLNNNYKYVPVRRLALYIEASLKRGLQWAVFEPNAEPLWAGIRLSVGSFMNTLFRQGAFAGTTAGSAYFVACDATTTTPTDQAQGIVNVTVGFAPLYPAEFVVITIQQMAGQTPT